MSGICGWIGNDAPEVLERMLAAIDYRGDASDRAIENGVALGIRYWSGRSAKAQGVFRKDGALCVCAGAFAPAEAEPGAFVSRAIADASLLTKVDGAFAFAHFSNGTLTLGRDPFGVRSLYWVLHKNNVYFATELKQLLAIPDLPVELDEAAIHKYLTFSFVPGESVPIRGVRRLLPGHTLARTGDTNTIKTYFRLEERIDPELSDVRVAARRVRALAENAVAKRVYGEEGVGLFLSGGLDSSAVGVWLKKAGVRPHAFSLDFGDKSVEREEAAAVAKTLELEQTWVPVRGEDVLSVFWDVVHRLDLPFGDPVTVPQYLLGRAARERNLTCVFNGEGGDQLFGGWTSKPMIAAELYAGLYEESDTSREETYLRSYHRFYGLEEELYAPDFKSRVGAPGQRRAHLRPYLGDEGDAFLNRVRLADISLKGSQNILPRAERMANAWGLDARTPLFDRELAEASFCLPPELKLRGACEKYILKRVMKRDLPAEIVWRKKFGMNVPVTDFVQGPLAGLMEDLLGEASTKKRGLFRPEFVRKLLRGEDVARETRRRRVGERLWALAMLEGWMRTFIDRRGDRVR